MKSNSNLRHSAGAMLGLVAVVIVVLFVIGAFMYFAGRLISGNNQLNIASDAGILNAARQALVSPAVALNDPSLPKTLADATSPTPLPMPYDDFAYGNIADQKINNYPAIDLLTYNRCAAQSVLVGLQAEKIGTATARLHARAVSLAVVRIGQKLQQLLSNGSLDSYYDSVANANSLSMLGIGSSVIRTASLTPAYVGQGRPSNIYFLPDITNMGNPNALSTIPQDTATSDVKPDMNKVKIIDPSATAPVNYASGYFTTTIMNGTPEASVVAFVPLNPQGTPHAIDQQRVAAGTSCPTEPSTTSPTTKMPIWWVPPNAFEANSQAKVQYNGSVPTSGNTQTTGSTFGGGSGAASTAYVHAISAAMVGAGAQDFPATIPGGYVRVVNIPDMVSNNNLPLGPVPASGESNCVDASNFIVNKEALGPGGSGNLTVYVGTPIPLNGDGTIDADHTVIGFDANGKAAMNFWINFNKSRVAPGSSNYNADVVTINGVKEHRDVSADGLKNPSSGDILNAGKDWTAGTLRMGASAGEKAKLSSIVKVTGYVELHSLVIDGTTAVNDSNGKPVSATLVADALFDVVGPNLGDTPPTGVSITVPEDSKGWTQVEYLKYKIIEGFKKYYHAGHFEIPPLSQQQLLTGLKYLNWFEAHGKQIRISSPNNFVLQTTGSSKGVEIPTSCQFMSTTTPAGYLGLIDNVIQNKGGYKAQITLAGFEQEILNQLRLINPKWTIQDLQTALNSQVLPLGTTLYLHDDGKGNLVMTPDLGQPDTQVVPEGFTPTTDFNRDVWFNTLATQDLDLEGYVLNTTLDGSKTAYKGDANVEQQPWRTVSGDIKLEIGAVLYRATGYNNLVGHVNFFSQSRGNFAGMSFSHPN